MDAPFIVQIIGTAVSIVTLGVLIIKVVRHITTIEGNICTQKAELEGKISAQKKRIRWKN